MSAPVIYEPTVFNMPIDPTHPEVALTSALLKKVDDAMGDDYKKSLVRQIQIAADLLELRYRKGNHDHQ